MLPCHGIAIWIVADNMQNYEWTLLVCEQYCLNTLDAYSTDLYLQCDCLDKGIKEAIESSHFACQYIVTAYHAKN